MPAIGSISTVASVGIWDPVNFFLTVGSVMCMVMVVSLCTCCKRQVKNRDPDDVYGVVNPTAVTITSGEGAVSHSVHFRSQKNTKITERHSQPSAKNTHTSGNSTRVSAPGRALPQLPADLYSVIDKTRKDDIMFVDEGFNPTYESIDPDADSFIDPLYSKVGDPRVTKKERKYDYPVFSGRKPPATTTTTNVVDGIAGPSTRPDETFYQSASQIYALGSEDPYSSITSVSRQNRDSGDGDSSSAYDPGYAKVKPNAIDSKKLERLEKTERELDDLYSKIRRHSQDLNEPPVLIPTVDSRILHNNMVIDDPLINIPPATDTQSVASREPSYRYITVRESADVVRERLRQQGELGPPIREHYYSTIGNEYETVGGDSSSLTYGRVQPVNNTTTTTTPLSIQTTTTTTREFVPPPPTSPIPDRIGTTRTSTDTLERIEPVSGATYTLLTKNKQQQHVNKKESGVRETTFGALDTEPTTSTQASTSWNPAPSYPTASSFAGLNRSFSNNNPFMDSSIGQPGPERATSGQVPSTSTVRGIHEFMQRPLLPYASGDPPGTIIGRKVTEEREVIVENRNLPASSSNHLQTSTTSLPVSSLRDGQHDPSRDSSAERVHHVEIRRIAGPSANDIISARRLRNSSSHQLLNTSATSTTNISSTNNNNNHEMLSASRSSLHPLNLSTTTTTMAESGPSSPYRETDNTVGGGATATTGRDDDSEGQRTSRSRTSSKSALPVLSNGDEVKKMTEKSRQRRQESLDREREEANRSRNSGIMSDRSLERRKGRKTETEEEKIQRLGTIYTANDYVSTIDMGTSRPWPMTGPSSPPSLRKSSTLFRGDSEHNNNSNNKNNNNDNSVTEG